MHRLSSFTYLNATQFLGALNDNIYKLLVVYFLIQLQGVEYSHQILAITGAIFVIPFLLFSAVSGVMADRFSKRTIIVLTKGIEIFVMLLGLGAFLIKSAWGAYTVLFLMAFQSALFGPSKYGIVPELVPFDRISKANGVMTSFTYLAIIIGACLASFITEVTGKNFVLASSFCVIVATIGLMTSLGVERTLPSGSEQAFQAFFLKEIYQSIQLARQYPSLLPSMLGAAYFLFIATFTQLNTIPFAVETLHLEDTQGGYLFFFPAVGIGIGALIAGRLSGRTIELGLVPIGALGGACFIALLGLYPHSLLSVLLFLCLYGISGGIYEVPLDAYMQMTAPKQMRGQIIATTNFLSFVASLSASGVLYISSEVWGLRSDQSFMLLGCITLIVTIAFIIQFFEQVLHFLASVVSRLFAAKMKT